MNDQNYREKALDLWDQWENEVRLRPFFIFCFFFLIFKRNSDEKIDFSSTKKMTYQDNIRLWKEANQRTPDVEIVNSPRTVYKPSLKILRRSVDQSNNLSASDGLPKNLPFIESQQGQREKEQRYREVRQKIFGAPSLENEPCAPIRSPVGPFSERGFSGGKS
ncbi:hypothetical protein PCANB_000801 [Pneumocystis canis]|nr:hypothetical protein PCK1_000776 [Pneumocystis canis]KAG5437370.1 hypothetical protein PCANB_000801 [Pneumocystis canis]